MMKKKDIVILSGITILVLILGMILLHFGYNESFYSENETVRMIFSVLTDVGSEMAYIVMLSWVIFAINMQFGQKLLVGFMINSFFNGFLKEFFMDPRPATNWVDGNPIEEGYGFPSGHTQNSLGFWGFTLYYNKNEVDDCTSSLSIQIISLFFLIVLPISRIIIGVHDLQDIVGGFVIGAIILIAYSLVLPKVSRFESLSLTQKILIGTSSAVIFWLLFALFVPRSAETLGQSSGLLIACAFCFPIERKYIKYEPRELSLGKKILSGIIGVIITLAVYFGLSALFGIFPAYAWLLRCIRYIILGIILLLLVPFILKKIFVKKPQT